MARFYLNSDNLNGDNSFVIENIKIDAALAEQLGSTGDNLPLASVFSFGDLNGDGNNDLFVQSSLFFAENSITQESFTILGNSSLPSTINITEINGSNGFTLGNGTALISSFDDINGDNLDELILTTINAISGTNDTAVILGKNEFPATIDPNALDGSNGFKISDGDNSVVSVSFTGDVNNDNINDLALISTSINPESSQTFSKIVFGQENYPANFDVSTLNGTNGFTVDDTAIIGSFGFDVNGDEFDDLFFSSTNNPISYIVFGQSQFTPELDLNTLTANQGFSIIETGSNASDRLLGGFAGDINGDGNSDIIIQKTVENTEIEAVSVEQIFVIYGDSQNTNTVDLATLDGTNGFKVDFEANLQTIVDINGDNQQDLFIKNLTDNKTYVIFGSETLPASIDQNTLNSLDGTNGFVIANTNIETQTIANFGAIGDLNGDGIKDLGIDTEEDQHYILLGQEAFPASIDLTSTDTNAIEISGTQSVNGISGFSDINGDGADEIIFYPVTDQEDENLANSTIVYGDSELSFATNNSGGENPEPEPEPNPNPNPEPETNQTIELFRFRNDSFASGTYVFVGEAERDGIQADENLNNTFSLDGEQEDGSVNAAFKASVQPGDDLIPFFRLKSLDVPGTFLFVSTAEYDAIFASDSDQQDKWEQEGLDSEGNDVAEFYLLDGSANRGVEFNRFQNTQNGTFLYAGPDETTAIENDPNLSGVFVNQGVAFESLI